MTFRDATDRLSRIVSQEEIASAIGVSRNTISRARMDPKDSDHRTPPPGWEKALAKLARERGGELLELAEELEGEG